MKICDRPVRRGKEFRMVGLLGLFATVWLLTGCATSPATGEKESVGEALERMDQSVENTISRLQNKTYNE